MRCRGVAVAMAALALVPGAAALASPVLDGSRDVAPSRDGGSLTAKIVVRTIARTRPGSGDPVSWIETSTRWGDGPQQFLVLDRRLDVQGREWLRVLLPIRPNGSAGWIRADHTFIGATPYWIDLSLGARTITVYRRGRAVRRFRAVIGAPETPTPIGLYAVYDPIAQGDGTGFLGPWALHLTAFSNVLDDFGGGPGRIAIHGRSGASLRDPLGSARSHGCVRVDNENVTWLARTVPRGTPVLIRR